MRKLSKLERIKIWFLALLAVLAYTPIHLPAMANTVAFLDWYEPEAVESLSSTEAIEAQKLVGQTIAQSFSDVWDRFISTDSVFWSSMLAGFSYLLVVGFAGWLMYAVWQWHTSNPKRFPWEQMYVPLLVVILYANDGQLMVTTAHMGRTLINGTNEKLLDQAVDGVTGRQHLQNRNLETAYNRVVDAKSDRCDRLEIGEKQEACKQEVKEEAAALAEALSKESGGGFKGLPDPVGNLVYSAFEQVAVGVLTFSNAFFHLFLAYILAVWASTAPFWAALHLIPSQSRGFRIYLSGFLAAGTAVLLYTTLSIAAASQLDSLNTAHSILYPTITGLINPIIALLGGAIGFNAVLSGTGAIAVGIGRLVRR